MAYSFYRTVTIDHTKVTGSDQTNFPVLILGTFSFLATVGNGGKLQNGSGFDFIFTSDLAGTIKLNYERVLQDITTGNVELWVNVPTVSHTVDTVFYIFYADATVSTDQSNKHATWNSNFQFVSHLPNGSSLTAADSTSNALTVTNSGATAVAGQIDGAANFGGSGKITVGSSSVLHTNIGVWSGWLKTSQSGAFAAILNISGSPNSENGGIIFLDSSTGELRVQLKAGSSSPVLDIQSSGAVNNSSWHHFAFVFNSTSLATVYVDGSSVATGTPGGSWSFDSAAALELGESHDGFWATYNGSLDEIHVQNATVTADWVHAEYENQLNAAIFSTFGSETANPNFVILLTDSLSFSDSIITLLLPLRLNTLVNDSYTISDGTVVTSLFGLLQTKLKDSLEFFDLLEDTFFAAARFQHLVDFPHLFKDSLSTQATSNPMGMTDFLNFSDSVKQQLNILAHLSDTILISDSVIGVSSDKSPVLSDSLSFSDSVQTQLIVQLSIHLTDTLAFTDTLDQTPSTNFNSYIRRYLNDVV